MAEAQRNRLTTGERLSSENRILRCEALSGQDKDDCMLQMSGQDTITQGSVEVGGILRETTITIPGTAQTQPVPGLAPATR